MKRKFIKKTVSAILSVLLILTLTVGISAHEMFYLDYGTYYVPIELKWVNMLNGKAYLKVNSDGLSNAPVWGNNYTIYVEQYANTKYVWNNCASSVTVTSTSANNATVIYTTPSETEWRWLVGEGEEYDVFGTTRLYDSSSNYIQNVYTASISNGNIVKAYIYMSPYVNARFNGNSTAVRATFVHETGHALTLGHPNTSYDYVNVASVMISGQTVYTTYQPHDEGDIRAKYG